MEKIYLDHAATSPVSPEVVTEMLPYFTENFGNPSSIHSFGREARKIVDEAREVVAKSIGSNSNEIVFTSGGTEADNTAVIGAARANYHKGNHIITTSIEHHAILHACKYLEKQGYKVTYLPVNNKGLISLSDLREAVTENTILVSVMLGNNEVGSIQPISEIGAFLKDSDILFHTDAVQAFGVTDIDVNQLGIDLLSVSAHKINGPKGIGFLYLREGVRVEPAFFGGEQERKRRAGTENVASIVGLKKSVELASKNMDVRNSLYKEWKDTFLSELKGQRIDFQINGDLDRSLPHILNISFAGMNVESLLVNLDLVGIAASSGSACTAGSIEPSHVLTAMFGDGNERGTSSIRFSFGYGNTKEQILRAAKETCKIIKRLTAK